MATGGDPTKQELCVTQETGSNHTVDYICFSCSDTEMKVASVYCGECEEWLCSDCSNYHKRKGLPRRHVLLTKDDIKKTEKTVKAKDKCTLKCEKHLDMCLEYYCSYHDYFGCSKCFIKEHKTCNELSIAELSSNDNHRAVVDRLTAIEKAAGNVLPEMKQNMKLVVLNQENIMESFRVLRSNVIQSLDRAEIQVISELSKHKEAVETRIKTVSQTVDKIKSDVRVIQDEEKRYEKTGQYYNAYIYSKREETTVKSLENAIQIYQALEPFVQQKLIQDNISENFANAKFELVTLRCDKPCAGMKHCANIRVSSKKYHQRRTRRSIVG